MMVDEYIKNIQDEKFEAEFSNLKLFNIKINEILWLYPKYYKKNL